MTRMHWVWFTPSDLHPCHWPNCIRVIDRSIKGCKKAWCQHLCHWPNCIHVIDQWSMTRMHRLWFTSSNLHPCHWPICIRVIVSVLHKNEGGINSSTGMDQEIHPCGQGRVDSVKINPSLLRMREWHMISVTLPLADNMAETFKKLHYIQMWNCELKPGWYRGPCKNVHSWVKGGRQLPCSGIMAGGESRSHLKP